MGMNDRSGKGRQISGVGYRGRMGFFNRRELKVATGVGLVFLTGGN